MFVNYFLIKLISQKLSQFLLDSKIKVLIKKIFMTELFEEKIL